MPTSAAENSEGAATIKKDKDHGRSCQGDQGEGSEVGDEVKINAHNDWLVRLALELNLKVRHPCHRASALPL
jgi:hypothetical protein